MKERRRRLVVSVIIALVALGSATFSTLNQKSEVPHVATGNSSPQVMATETSEAAVESAEKALGQLAIKGRAPKTGYARAQFGNGWADTGNCDMRNYILGRDLREVKTASPDDCSVVSGVLDDPYTAKTITFVRGPFGSKVQIDHVVALSDAWQKGAQALPPKTRYQFANDPLNLLAVDGPANQQKGDGDAATWLPHNKSYRCRYVARQIAVKQKYTLWVTEAEAGAMQRVLSQCPGQALPVVSEPAL